MPRPLMPTLPFPPDARYLNREISWLRFNARVLEEAFDTSNPLLERLNFLAISASNLDEFYMVRVAGLQDCMLEGIQQTSIDGLTPAQELALIHQETTALVWRQHQAWQQLREELARERITFIHPDHLHGEDLAWLSAHFMENIFPVLTPIAIDPAHPFPFLPNLSLALMMELAQPGQQQANMAVVPLPLPLPRFVALPGDYTRFVALEDIITFFIDALFPGFGIRSHACFRVVRDSELELEDEAENFMRHIERAVKERRFGRVIRVRFPKPSPPHLVRFVTEQLQVAPEDVVEMEGMIGLRHLREVVEAGPQRLRYASFAPRFPERIDDFGGDCFAAIAAKDIVIHHPYESFDVVVRFLEQAAADPNVVSIKQTLYRTSGNSPIVKALIAAAENGKSVTALVELKARFDEEANVRFAQDMERAGVQVVFGFVRLKTHAKVSLITRREEGHLVSYAHFGTGNYHPNTARLYTDLSFFTTNIELCKDAAHLFNFITGSAPPRLFRQLVVAPRFLRTRLIELLDAEIAHARAGRPAAVWAKMNALVDATIIDKLYEASNAGVRIELVVRGICCLKPGMPGLSEHIRVKSLVGRFLEHARIYCFADGHPMPSPHAKVFIGSADWMPRNLDWRVELMVPVTNPTVHAQVLEQIMVANLKDEFNSWQMRADGTYEKLPAEPGGFSAHEYFLTNPSLSGRGTALKKIKSEQMLAPAEQKKNR